MIPGSEHTGAGADGGTGSSVGPARGGVVGLLVCVVVALALAVVTPDPVADQRRRFVDVAVGRPASSTDVTARVVRVHLAEQARRSFGDPFRSGQRLVVVEVQASVRHRVIYFRNVWLLSRDERRYEPRSEFSGAALLQTQPGFTRTSTLVFEVPPERVAGARLVIDSDEGKFDVYATALRVDLGLFADTAVDSEPATVPDSTLAVTR